MESPAVLADGALHLPQFNTAEGDVNCPMFDPSYTHSNTCNGDLEMVNFVAHPTADDVTIYMGSWGHGISIDQPVEWLGSTWPLNTWSDVSDDGVYQSGEEGDFIAGALYDHGCGSVVALGDNALNQACYTYGNIELLRSILE